MRYLKTCAILIALSLISMLSADLAYAQATRTWVSGVGDDANPCSRTAPCKTFAGAISKTAAGGEISVLDPGGFGAVTITKSISIINDYSGEAGILGSGTNGITVNAGASDVVILRGLVIDGAPPTTPGLNGIRFIAGAALHVQKCVIKNFQAASAGNGNGILFAPSGTSRLFVSDTIILHNGGASNGAGVMVKPTGAAAVRVSLSNVQVLNNTAGIILDGSGGTGGIRGGIHDSISAGNNGDGIVFHSVAGAGSILSMIDHVASFSNGGNGVLADGSTVIMLVGNSAVTANNIGFATANSGQILSYQNNAVAGQFSGDGSASGPISPK